jgi:uncharacterized protein YodC (DUF2158 family)
MTDKENTKIQAGDVVRLKSGGPDMTVERKDIDGSCICAWFENSIPYSKNFFEDSLKPVDTK